jgi:hypothetical protein
MESQHDDGKHDDGKPDDYHHGQHSEAKRVRSIRGLYMQSVLYPWTLDSAMSPKTKE